MNVVDNEISKLERENLADMYKTALFKVKFINEIKSGLGEEMRANPNKVKVIKKPWYSKITPLIKKIFTKF